MSRSWLTWSVLAACALLIVGAMAWSTNKAIQLEEKQALAESDAELEERVRMSLARMDSAASGLMILENQRPLHHYEPFFEPEDVLTASFPRQVDGFAHQLSPLLPELPEFVRLHFEIDASNGGITSPQVPVGSEWRYALQNGIRLDHLSASKGQLTKLRSLLAESADLEPGYEGTKMDLLCRVCARNDEALATISRSWNIPDPVIVEEVEQKVAKARASNDGISQIRSQAYTQDLAIIEKNKRAELYQSNYRRAVPKLQIAGRSVPRTDEGPATAARKQKANVESAPKEDSRSLLSLRDAGTEERESRQAAELVESPSRISPFHPVWLGSELFMVREALVAGTRRYQAVWLRAGDLGANLLHVIRDLLPHAALEPISEVSASSSSVLPDEMMKRVSNDPYALVTLPWRIQPGEEPLRTAIGWSPLRISLTAGWVVLLLALLGSAMLMSGVMRLSERRATFVSSVTHELRTPLTTFHLYSDMLAEGMVKEESKKKEYLRTMRREAERLNHLVENVLSYSRVERGSARAECQKVRLKELLERMVPRLDERVRKEEGELRLLWSAGAEEAEVDTDLTAVEQIIFNLVDNACKYGMPEEGERAVLLNVSVVDSGSIRIEVSDWGPGVPHGDVKKLFRPFHKSAREAAHSKPGVGLGLALSRRLARELGGELSLCGEKGEGSCFVLELPAVS